MPDKKKSETRRIEIVAKGNKNGTENYDGRTDQTTPRGLQVCVPLEGSGGRQKEM